MSDQELNVKFVGEVEKHEQLYNYKLPAYSRKDVTEKVWQMVAAEVNLSGKNEYNTFYRLYNCFFYENMKFYKLAYSTVKKRRRKGLFL